MKTYTDVMNAPNITSGTASYLDHLCIVGCQSKMRMVERGFPVYNVLFGIGKQGEILC